MAAAMVWWWFKIRYGRWRGNSAPRTGKRRAEANVRVTSRQVEFLRRTLSRVPRLNHLYSRCLSRAHSRARASCCALALWCTNQRHSRKASLLPKPSLYASCQVRRGKRCCLHPISSNKSRQPELLAVMIAPTPRLQSGYCVLSACITSIVLNGIYAGLSSMIGRTSELLALRRRRLSMLESTCGEHSRHPRLANVTLVQIDVLPAHARIRLEQRVGIGSGPLSNAHL